MKKVSLVFATRESLWAFLNVSHGANVSIHQRVYCLTGSFPEEEIQMATDRFHAQVFESIYSEKAAPPPVEKPQAPQFSFSPSFLIL
jgi:hypothetical protein